MTTAVASPAQQAQQALLRQAFRVGRSQGLLQFFQQTFDPTNGPVIINAPRTIPLTLPLKSIWIELKGRLADTVANYTAVAPEAPYNWLQNIQLTGTATKFGGQKTIINMSGASAFVWPFLFGAQGSQAIINNTLAAAPGIPQTSSFLGTTAGSPYDIRVLYNIPLYPLAGNGQAQARQSTNFLLLSKDWQNSLQLTLNIGDKSAFGDPTGATVAWTAFGSGAGNPTCTVYLEYVLNGDQLDTMDTGLVLRAETMLTQFSALAPQGTLLANLQHAITTNVAIRTGTIQTAGLTAGVTTLAAVSDTQLDATQLIIDGRNPLRPNTNNLAEKAFYASRFGVVQPQGWINLSFVDSLSASLAYRGDTVLQGGSQFQLTSQVVSASANNRQFYIQEQLLGGPFPANGK